METETLEIPTTTKTRYLSGIVALNIPSDEPTGDWHFEQTFLSHHDRMPITFLLGEGQPCNTLPLLGDAGIYDCSAVLDCMHIAHPPGPVYAASHARAIADMVLCSVLRDRSPDHVGLDDWMPRDQDKLAVVQLLEPVKRHLDDSARTRLINWLSNNMAA